MALGHSMALSQIIWINVNEKLGKNKQYKEALFGQNRAKFGIV